MRYIVKWSALLAVALVMSVAAFAQQSGGLQGKISDEAGQPVIGAMIQVTGPSLQGFQGAATDTNGQYVIPVLPVGTGYQVKVEAPGYNSVIRKGIAVQLGMTVSLPFTLSQGKTEIVVTAAAPIIDVKKTQVGADISEKMIQSIPLARNSDGIAFLAPGVVQGTTRPNTNVGPSFGGASGPENSYTVNGVEVTGSGDGLNLTALNFDFIEATEVKTGGLDAEYGALMGGMVNSITKSGGNEFHGSLFAYYFDDGLGAKERGLNNSNVVNYRTSFKQYDLGGSLGGYFIKDKLWFFVSYDWNKTETGWSANGSDNNVKLNGRPSYSYHYGSSYVNKETDPQYAVKLTWNVSPNHKLAFTWFGNNNKYEYLANLNNPGGVASPYTRKTDNYALSVLWNATWTPKFFTEAVFSRRNTSESAAPNNALAANSRGYYYRFGSGTYAGYQVIPTDGVAPSFYGWNSSLPTYHQIDLASWSPSLGGRTHEATEDRNDQIRLKGTNLFNLAGRHELSYGFQYFDIKYDYNFNYTGPGMTEAYAGNPFYGRTTPGGVVVRWQPQYNSAHNFVRYLYRAQGFMNDQNKKTTQKYTAYWAQDNWNLTDYFMLKIGLRLDQIHMKGGDNSVNVPSTFADPGMSNGRARSVNINDMWAPRIGFTWDVAHNNKSKLYGFWGQYYERIPNDMAIRALTDEYFHFSYYTDSSLTTPFNNAGYHYTYGLYPTKIVGGPGGGSLKGSYNEETLLGFQYEVAPDFTVGVRGIYRNLGRVIEDISLDGASSYIVTNPDAWTNVWVPDVFGRVNPDGSPWRWRFPKPVRQYRALEITAEKRFSNHWMMQGSYVLSRLDGNYEGLFSNDNGQLDPNITSKYDIPSLLVNGYGLLPNDRTHVLHLFGGYFFENMPLELSGNFILQSGIPISALGADDAYGMNEGFAKVRGTAGRTPTLWAIDLGAEYKFKIWKSNLALRADIFNVTNEQRTTSVDQTFNTINTQPTQNYINFKKELAHQMARRIRLSLRWTF